MAAVSVKRSIPVLPKTALQEGEGEEMCSPFDSNFTQSNSKIQVSTFPGPGLQLECSVAPHRRLHDYQRVGLTSKHKT